MKELKWYTPQLVEVDIQQLIKTISVKASSPDCLGGNVLKGDIGGGGQVPGGGLPEGDWWKYCIEVGPLGGCDSGFLVCSTSGITILSNGDIKI